MQADRSVLCICADATALAPLSSQIKQVSFLSGTLLAELREYNLEQQRRAQADSHSPDAPPEESSISGRLKGKMTSRFGIIILVCLLTLSRQLLNVSEKRRESLTDFHVLVNLTVSSDDSYG